jgi:hypothetical protein
MQARLDRDSEARESRLLAREDARSQRLVYFEKAAFLCGTLGAEAGSTQHLRAAIIPAPKLLPPLVGDDVARNLVTETRGVTRKRAARVYDAAQKANNAKQNLRRGKILKAQTAAKSCNSEDPGKRRTQAGVQHDIADDSAVINGVEAVDNRIVGAVADWWSRKRSPPTSSERCSEVGSVKRFRLNCKTSGVAPGT